MKITNIMPSVPSYISKDKQRRRILCPYCGCIHEYNINDSSSSIKSSGCIHLNISNNTEYRIKNINKRMPIICIILGKIINNLHEAYSNELYEDELYHKEMYIETKEVYIRTITCMCNKVERINKFFLKYYIEYITT